MSDPKWATDIANKKPKISWDSLAGKDNLDDTGSATISRQTTGVQTEATNGHTSKKYLWAWTDFAGAIASVKSLTGIPSILKLLKGGKSELISFADSTKILGGQSRSRIGIKASPLQAILGKIPFIGPKHAKTIAEWAYWKESQLTYGDRSDVIVGHINRAVVRGHETVVYSGSDEDKSKVKLAKKFFGWPGVEYKKGTTRCVIGSSDGYQFMTDKSYKVTATQGESGDPNEISFSASDKTLLKLISSESGGVAQIATDDFRLVTDSSSEIISKTKTIKSKKMELACEDSFYVGTKNTGIKVTNSNVIIQGQTDLGSPISNIIYDQEEYDDVEREELEQERLRLEQEQNNAIAGFLEDLGD